MSQTIQKLGEQIAFYRKKAGLTQSALAEMISVSTQAVSRWERGGAPDVAVLPALAQALQVSIDQLFDVPSRQHVDIPQLLKEEFKGLPQKEVFETAYQYTYAIMQAALGSYEKTGGEFHQLLEAHRNVNRRTGASYLTFFSSDSGIMSTSVATDFHYFLLMPEPDGGYASVMKHKAAYLHLFQLLAKEYRLDMLLYLYGENREGFTAPKAAMDLNIPEKLAEEILEELYNLNFLQTMQFASTDGKLTVYRPGTGFALIPFLYFGAELMVSSGSTQLGYYARATPFLNAPLGEGGIATDWITKSEKFCGDVKPGFYGHMPSI